MHGGYEKLIWTNCTRQPESQLPSLYYNHNTLTNLRPSVMRSIQMHFKVLVSFPHRCSEGCQCIVQSENTHMETFHELQQRIVTYMSPIEAIVTEFK